MYSAFKGAVRRLSIVLGAIAGAGTALLMLTVVPDLVARSFFGEAVYGMAETGIFMLVLIVYLALSVAQVRKEHFHVGVLDAVLSRRQVQWLWLFRHVVSAVVCGVFSWYASLGAYASTVKLEQSYAVIEYPIWPAKIVVAFGLVLLTIQFVIDAIDAVVHPETLPRSVLPVEGAEAAGAL